MQLLETLLIVAVALLITSLCRTQLHTLSLILLVTAFAVAICNYSFEVWRWPVTLIYISLVIAGYKLVRDLKHPETIAVWYLVLMATPLLISLFFLRGVLFREVPKPSGPYPVGVTEFYVQDESRQEKWGDLEPQPRSLYVKTWYPGSNQNNLNELQPSPLWSELYTQPQFKMLGRVFGFYRHLPTTAYENLKIANDQRFPVLVYNHAIVSYPSENNLLLNELASHGYVIFSVSQINQQDEFAQMQNTDSHIGSATEQVLKDLKIATTDEEKAKVGLEYFEGSTATNALVKERAQDIQFLLNRLLSQKDLPAAIKEILKNSNLQSLGLVGHSLGGAVASEFGKLSSYTSAIVNIDGGLFGSAQKKPVTVPYLMFLNELSSELNAFQFQLAKRDYFEYVFLNTRHGDFTDQAQFLPVMKWLRVLGTANADEILNSKNSLVLDFLNKYLKNEESTFILSESKLEIRERVHSVKEY